jgi:hypothetical protein
MSKPGAKNGGRRASMSMGANMPQWNVAGGGIGNRGSVGSADLSADSGIRPVAGHREGTTPTALATSPPLTGPVPCVVYVCPYLDETQTAEELMTVREKFLGGGASGLETLEAVMHIPKENGVCRMDMGWSQVAMENFQENFQC